MPPPSPRSVHSDENPPLTDESEYNMQKDHHKTLTFAYKMSRYCIRLSNRPNYSRTLTVTRSAPFSPRTIESLPRMGWTRTTIRFTSGFSSDWAIEGRTETSSSKPLRGCSTSSEYRSSSIPRKMMSKKSREIVFSTVVNMAKRHRISLSHLSTREDDQLILHTMRGTRARGARHRLLAQEPQTPYCRYRREQQLVSGLHRERPLGQRRGHQIQRHLKSAPGLLWKGG